MGQGRKEMDAYVGHSEPLHELPWLQVLKRPPNQPSPLPLPAPVVLYTRWTDMSVGE